MTKILGRDPGRRCKPVNEWPPGDRLRRMQALVGGDVLEEGGLLANYSLPYLRRLDSGYGRWLQWLDMQGYLDMLDSPATRVTRQRVAEYTLNLRRSNSTKTTSSPHESPHFLL